MEATRHFGKIEAAMFITDTEFVAKHNATEDVARNGMKRSTHNFASPYELGETLARAQIGRASGPDEVTDDLAKVAPREMARHMRPVMAKVALFCRANVAPKEAMNLERDVHTYPTGPSQPETGFLHVCSVAPL